MVTNAYIGRYNARELYQAILDTIQNNMNYSGTDKKYRVTTDI